MSRRLRLALGSQRAFRCTIKRVFAELDRGASLAIIGGAQWQKQLRFIERRSTNGRPDAGKGGER